MAIVIIGGLVSSTFLTLFLLPVLYEWFGWRLVQGQE
jgi:cobalt-zinc-cadmium resistance protein CzcA